MTSNSILVNTLKDILSLLLFLLAILPSKAQDCNKWLHLPNRESYVTLGDLDIPGTTITVEALFMRTAPYFNNNPLYAGDLVTKHNTPDDVNYLLRPNSAEITTTNGYFFAGAPCVFELNRIYHVAMVYDGNFLRYYRNGHLMSTVPATGQLIQNDLMAKIGYYDANVNPTFTIGFINEVRIWQSVRSQAEIKDFMFRSIPNPELQPGLRAYYIFNNLTNRVGNNLWNGSLSGTAKINQAVPNCIFENDSCGIIVNACATDQGIHKISAGADVTICHGDTTTLMASGGSKFVWQPQISITNPQSATVRVWPTTTTKYIVSGINVNDCPGTDTVLVTVQPLPELITEDSLQVCSGQSLQLLVTGALLYSWRPAVLLQNPESSQPVARPLVSTHFKVKGVNAWGCSSEDSVWVEVVEKRTFSMEPISPLCPLESVTLRAHGGDVYEWLPAAFFQRPNSASTTALFESSTAISLSIRDTICNRDTTISTIVELFPLPVIRITKSNDITCTQTSATLTATGAATYTWQNFAGLANANDPRQVVSGTQPTTYTISGTSTQGCTDTTSIVVNVLLEQDRELFIPTGFTPNGDNLNDCFGITHWGAVTQLDFKIFDRWGNLVFHTNDSKQCWDGRYKGNPLQSGTFAYAITATTLCSGTVLKKGLVHLLR